MSVGVRTIYGWVMMGLGICLFLAFPNSKDTDGRTTRNNSPVKKLSKFLFFGGLILVATDPVNLAAISNFQSK